MNLKGIVIGVAIFILTLFVAIYGMSVFMPQPVYEDFCDPVKTAEFIDNAQRCEEVGGFWNVYEQPRPEGSEGFCDRDYYCRQDYQNAFEENSRQKFFVSIPLGILIIILGGVVFRLESVGVGLMAGGAGTLVYGAGGFWSYASDMWRFIISLLGLVALILFTYWFETRRKGFWKKFFGKKK